MGNRVTFVSSRSNYNHDTPADQFCNRVCFAFALGALRQSLNRAVLTLRSITGRMERKLTSADVTVSAASLQFVDMAIERCVAPECV
jgi:hypothetical protein